LFIEGYLIYLISIRLNLDNPYPFSKNGENWALYTSYIFAAICWGFIPFLLLYVNCQPRSHFSDKRMIFRLSILIEDVKPTSIWDVNYFTIYCVQRLLFVKIVFDTKLASV
jgi:hypothetical protein